LGRDGAREDCLVRAVVLGVDVSLRRGLDVVALDESLAVFLRGCLPPPGTTRRTTTKREWRAATLRAAGVDPARLAGNRRGDPTMDSVDAALAAVTAARSLEGDFTSFGRAGEWIVVPGRAGGPFRLCGTT
jgi:hypothetical protein